MSAAHTLHLTGYVTPEQAATYLHLPFDVPASVTQIDVSYTYSDNAHADSPAPEGSIIDIGIFDARGTTFMSPGFRGWSGSARRTFSIAPHDATPGYLAGAILTGTWSICLGLYRIAPHGCEYHVTITLQSDDLQPRAAAQPTLTSGSISNARADGWYCGEMHCHSLHSDGDSTAAEVVAHAEALGLDFLAITDHNTLSHLAALADVSTHLLLIPGMEVTTYQGHWNIWGAAEWIDFRVTTREDMRRAIEAARERGLVISLNHPRPFGPEWAYSDVDDFDCIEVWNGAWAWFNEDALAFWEERLRAGRRITAVGGSDSHFHHREHPARLGQPTMWVHAAPPLTAETILRAIRAGRVTLSDSPTAPRLTIAAAGAGMGDVVRLEQPISVMAQFDGAEGLTLAWHTDSGCIERQVIAAGTTHATVTISPPVRFIRAQLVYDGGAAEIVRALTNPIYFV